MNQLLANDRTRSAMELMLVLGMAEVWLWETKGLYRAFAILAIALIGLNNYLRHPDVWRRTQPSWGGLSSWVIIITITFALGAGAVISGEFIYTEGEQLRLGRLERVVDPKFIATKTLVVTVQQLALHRFLFPSFLEIFRSRAVALCATALTFGALHLPSVFLVSATIPMAAIWIYLFERTQRLAPLIFCHLVLVVVVSAVFPERLTYNLGVGRNALPVARSYERLAQEPLATKYDELKSNAYYVQNGGTDRTFIHALYRDVLQRSPAENEIDVWLPTLHRSSRAEAVAQFLNSEEFLALRCRLYGECR